jgi:hypothetical protein
MQTQAERRFTKGFSLLSSWTWSHALDGISSSEDFTLEVLPQDFYNLSFEKASASIRCPSSLGNERDLRPAHRTRKRLAERQRRDTRHFRRLVTGHDSQRTDRASGDAEHDRSGSAR